MDTSESEGTQWRASAERVVQNEEVADLVDFANLESVFHFDGAIQKVHSAEWAWGSVAHHGMSTYYVVARRPFERVGRQRENYSLERRKQGTVGVVVN